MTDARAQATSPIVIGAAAEGGPGRRAAGELDARANELVAAVRRGVPFIARRSVPITAAHAAPVTLSAAIADLDAPVYLAHLATDPGGYGATLAFGARAVAYLLNGVLGGGPGDEPPALDRGGLTAPQKALVSRVADDVVAGLSKVLGVTAGFRLSRLPDDRRGRTNEGALVSLPFSIGEGGQGGRFFFACAKEPLMTGSAAPALPRGPSTDARVESCLLGAHVRLVAELGRVRLRVSELAMLRVGDTLRLDVPLDASLPLRVGDRVLFEGHPTTSGGQIALRLSDKR
jgi:flagellar motor switch protein FliM